MGNFVNREAVCHFFRTTSKAGAASAASEGNRAMELDEFFRSKVGDKLQVVHILCNNKKVGANIAQYNQELVYVSRATRSQVRQKGP
jgi:hypothetical protein